MHGAKKSVRYFSLRLFSLTLAHGYFQASSESSEDQMPPAVAGATLSKLHVVSDDTHGQSHAPATDGHQHAGTLQNFEQSTPDHGIQFGAVD